LLPEMMGLPAVGELETQAEILKSRVIAEQVVKRLDLDKKVEREDSFLLNLKERIFGLATFKKEDKEEEHQRFNAVVRSVQGRTRVEPVRNTDLIRVKVEDAHPEQAMEIANALADVFVDLNLTFERGEAKSVYEFTREQLAITKESLRKSEEGLKGYKEKTGISALDEETKGDIQKIVNLETIYSQTRTARQEAEVKLKDVRKQLAELNEKLAIETIVAENREIKDLKAKLAGLELEVESLRRRYGEGSSSVIKAKKELEKTREDLTAMITNLISRKTSTITPYLPDVAKPVYQKLMATLVELETEVNSSEAKEKALASIIKEHESKLEGLPAKELELARLTRASEVDEKIYKFLLEKNEEARIAEAMQIGNIRVVDPAIKPDTPIKPKKRLNAILGAIVGLMLGLGLAFFMEYLDPSIKTVEEAERIGGLPIMGVIPVIKVKDTKAGRRKQKE
ncbi:GumC family protein, partial [bacterium]|nr:GumC family protein [bacterium]